MVDDEDDKPKKKTLSPGAAAGIGILAGVVLSAMVMLVTPWIKHKVQSRRNYASHNNEEMGVEMGRDAV